MRADPTKSDFVDVATGSNLVRLTATPDADEDPAWSADGSQVAFVSSRDGNREIYVMNADGSNPGRLTTNAAGDRHPAWSPDGKRIAFDSWRSDSLKHVVEVVR